MLVSEENEDYIEGMCIILSVKIVNCVFLFKFKILKYFIFFSFMR